MQWGKPRDVFRSDAKCEPGRIVLGGWLCEGGVAPSQAKWFALELGPREVPWLFRENGDTMWASTSAELLASYASAVAFELIGSSPCSFRDSFRVMVSAGTDNQSTPALQRKGITGNWPLMPLHMQVATTLQRAGKALKLTWRPRDTNTEADALTNGDFRSFDPSLRVALSWGDIPMGLFDSLAGAREPSWRLVVSQAALRGSSPSRRVNRSWKAGLTGEILVSKVGGALSTSIPPACVSAQVPFRSGLRLRLQGQFRHHAKSVCVCV